MSQYHGVPSNHISRWHLVEHFPSIFNAPTFCIHVDQTIPHKDITLTSTLNDLLINILALFKGNYVGTCIHHPHKSMNIWSHTLVLHVSKYFQCLLPLAIFHMSKDHGIPSEHISRWHLVEHYPSILKAPTFSIHVNQVVP